MSDESVPPNRPPSKRMTLRKSHEDKSKDRKMKNPIKFFSRRMRKGSKGSVENFSVVSDVDGGSSRAKEKKNRKSQKPKKKMTSRKSSKTPSTSISTLSMLQSPATTIDSPASLNNPKSQASSKTHGSSKATLLTTISREESKSKSKSEKATSADKIKTAEPWFGMEAGRKWIENNMKTEKIVTEFVTLQAIDVKKSSAAYSLWPDRNRNTKNVVYDENRVILMREKMDQPNYINASWVDITDFRCRTIIAQMPIATKDEKNYEDFWYMIYQEKVTVLFIVCTTIELEPLIPPNSGDYYYFGKMFVNNRKVEKEEHLKSSNIITLEVLPQGNSDSVLCKIFHYKNWISGHRLRFFKDFSYIVKDFMKEICIGDPNICILSLNGDGRACATLAAVAASTMLFRNIEPNIWNIMKEIKEQRYGATECFFQYVSVYILVTHYIKRQTREDKVLSKQAHAILKELIALKADEFTEDNPQR